MNKKVIVFGGGTGMSYLLRGVDSNKDQTYFLACLDQYQLSHTRLPLGELTKEQVRQIENIQTEIDIQNNLLEQRKNDRSVALRNQKREQDKLTADEKKQKNMLQSLKKKEKNLIAKQKEQQKHCFPICPEIKNI